VKILVGDNSSLDNTPNVLKDAAARASKLKVGFEHFRNTSNLGFSGNIHAGISKISSEYVMFLSDDDNLISESLTKVCQDIREFKPSVALYNFDQYPYDNNNPLIKQKDFVHNCFDYSQISTLLSWPKLTGVVLKSRNLYANPLEVSEICSFSKHFPHVVLAAYSLFQESSLLKSEEFIAYPDVDFLQHINFVPYIGEYLKEELRLYAKTFDKENLTLQKEIAILSQSSILDQSVNSLFGFYRGQFPLNRQVKSILESNLRQFVLFKNGTKDGLKFTEPTRIFYIKLLLLPITALTFRVLALLKLHRIRLMDSGF
jgi:glycosyltransferase involved in cell wall biosynthesis